MTSFCYTQYKEGDVISNVMLHTSLPTNTFIRNSYTRVYFIIHV